MKVITVFRCFLVWINFFHSEIIHVKYKLAADGLHCIKIDAKEYDILFTAVVINKIFKFKNER